MDYLVDCFGEVRDLSDGVSLVIGDGTFSITKGCHVATLIKLN